MYCIRSSSLSYATTQLNYGEPCVLLRPQSYRFVALHIPESILLSIPAFAALNGFPKRSIVGIADERPNVLVWKNSVGL